MATRLLICGILALIALGVLIAVTARATEVKVPDVLASLAVEAIGIVVTVGFVDVLLERDRGRARARAFAWSIINAVDHAIWLWQGGKRRFDAGELLGLVELIESNDPILIETQNLFLRLGVMSQNIMNMKDHAVANNQKLAEGIAALLPFGYIDEIPMSRAMMKSNLSNAITALFEVVGVNEIPTSADFRTWQSDRDSSEEAQHKRSQIERITLPAAFLNLE